MEVVGDLFPPPLPPRQAAARHADVIGSYQAAFFSTEVAARRAPFRPVRPVDVAERSFGAPQLGPQRGRIAPAGAPQVTDEAIAPHEKVARLNRLWIVGGESSPLWRRHSRF